MPDWRVNGQDSYLSGVKLKKMLFKNRAGETDHEHCEFCFEKISDHPDTLHSGYCTEDEYHWICEECYNDFKGDFKWEIF